MKRYVTIVASVLCISVFAVMTVNASTQTTASDLTEDKGKEAKQFIVENLTQDTGVKLQMAPVNGLLEDTRKKVEQINSDNLIEDTGNSNADTLEFWSVEEYELYITDLYNLWSRQVKEGHANQEEVDELYKLLLENLQSMKDGNAITKPILYEDGWSLVGVFEPKDE